MVIEREYFFLRHALNLCIIKNILDYGYMRPRSNILTKLEFYDSIIKFPVFNLTRFPEKTMDITPERKLLVEEFLTWLHTMEDDEQLRVEMSSAEFLSKVSDENLRALISSKRELYQAYKRMDSILKNRK